MKKFNMNLHLFEGGHSVTVYKDGGYSAGSASPYSDVAKDTEVTLNDLEKEGFPETVLEALRLLTHSPEEDYFTYIRRLKENPLARKVKLADLDHNSQLDRLPQITEKDRERLEKYQKAKEILNSEE